jgi:WD40 repeat protein
MIKRSKKNNKLKGGKPFVGEFCSEISTLGGFIYYDRVNSVTFYPNGNLLAKGSSEGFVSLCRFNDDGSNLRLISDGKWQSRGGVTSVAFHPKCNLLASCGYDELTARLYSFDDDGSNLECISILNWENRHTEGVLSVAFHPSRNLLATGSIDKRAKLWSFHPDGSNVVCTGIANGNRHTDEVTSVAFHPSRNLLATGSKDKTSKLWSFNDEGTNLVCTDTANVNGHTKSVISVAFHPSLNLLATGSWDNTAKLWSFNDDGTNLVCISTLAGHTDNVLSVALHPDGNFLATCSWDKTAKLWSFRPDGSNPRCIETLTGHTGAVKSVAFHPNGNLLATGSLDTTAKIWDCSKLNIQYRRRFDLTHGSLATSLIDELTTLPGPQNLDLKYKMRSVLHQSIGNVLGINTPASRANPDRMKAQKYLEFPSREHLQGPDTSTGLPPSPVVDTPLQPVVEAAGVTGFCAVDDTSCKGLYESIPWLELNSIPGDCKQASELLQKLVSLESLLISSSIPEIDSRLRLTTLWIKKLSKKIEQCRR